MVNTLAAKRKNVANLTDLFGVKRLVGFSKFIDVVGWQRLNQRTGHRKLLAGFSKLSSWPIG